MIIVYVLIIAAMFFFMSRTQKKQQQERKNLLDSLKVGDKVITIGGLHGVVADIRKEDNKNTVLLDCEGIYLEFNRSAIQQIVPTAAVSEVVEEETVEVEEAETEANDQE